MAVGAFYCPSRREAIAYPRNANGGGYSFLNSVHPDDRLWGVNDYVGSLGSTDCGNDRSDITYDNSETHTWPRPYSFWLGVIFERSEVRIKQVTDGTSHTYLIGERYLDPDLYTSDFAVRSPHWGGHDTGNVACTDYDPIRKTGRGFPPTQDQPGNRRVCASGSAHSGGFHMAMRDGSVRSINYELGWRVHQSLSTRAQSEVIDDAEL